MGRVKRPDKVYEQISKVESTCITSKDSKTGRRKKRKGSYQSLEAVEEFDIARWLELAKGNPPYC